METIEIFLSSDNNYAPFIATTIASICANTKRRCNFYILDGGITNINRVKICNLKKRFSNFSIEFININTDIIANKIDYRNNGDYITISTYNRFLIPDLQPNLKKVLYLDVDIIVNGDISNLYDIDLENYSLGAIWEKSAEQVENKARKEYLKLNSEHKYFNAGVLLIDIQKWKNENIKDKLFNIENTQRNILKFADQDILNIYYNNNYKVIANEYNWLNLDSIILPDFIPVIRHFNGNIKPWQISPNITTSLLNGHSNFWKYAKKTDFYHELLEKTNDIECQKQYIRKLQIIKMSYKKMYLTNNNEETNGNN